MQKTTINNNFTRGSNGGFGGNRGAGAGLLDPHATPARGFNASSYTALVA